MKTMANSAGLEINITDRTGNRPGSTSLGDEMAMGVDGWKACFGDIFMSGEE